MDPDLGEMEEGLDSGEPLFIRNPSLGFLREVPSASEKTLHSNIIPIGPNEFGIKNSGRSPTDHHNPMKPIYGESVTDNT